MIKEGWERSKERRSVTNKEVVAITQSVFPGKDVQTFDRLENGFSNSNYRISLENDPTPFVIRLYNGKKGVATKEQNISRMITKTVPVPKYIHVDEGCDILDVPFAIVEWKNGVLLSELVKNTDESSVNSAAESVGRTLAEIHRYRFHDFGILNERLEVEESMRIDEELYLTLIRNFLDGKCGSYLGESFRRDLLTFCMLNSHNLSETGEKPVLVHSDYNGLNILMDIHKDKTSVSAVLDWEFAFSGSVYADIGNILRYEEESSVFETTFIEGYIGAGGILKDNWRVLSRLHDLIALCDLLDRSSSETPKRVQDLRYLISNSVKND